MPTSKARGAALSNIEIAQHAKMKPIVPLGAERLGIPESQLHPFGHYKAKIALDYCAKLDGRKDGKLILVTAISPTPAGEGKTTMTVGLGDALNRIGKKAIICLREPALGPVFGMKGGAAGGGYAQVVPMKTSTCTHRGLRGDGSRTTCSHPTTSIYHGNARPDVRRVAGGVLDVNDRALRDSTIGTADPATVISAGRLRHRGRHEVMAIFVSRRAEDLKDRPGHRRRLSREQAHPRQRHPRHGRGGCEGCARAEPRATSRNNPAFITGARSPHRRAATR